MLDVNGNNFKVMGSVITVNGWYNVDTLPDKKAVLPPISEGETYQGKYELKKDFTEPPKRKQFSGKAFYRLCRRVVVNCCFSKICGDYANPLFSNIQIFFNPFAANNCFCSHIFFRIFI